MLSKSDQVKQYGKKKKKASFKEADLQKACEKILDTMQISYIRIPDQMNSIVFGSPQIPVHVKKMISSVTKGVPDLTILFKSGKYICVELKTDVGRLSIGQKRFKNGVGEMNYYVVRSINEFQELLKGEM